MNYASTDICNVLYQLANDHNGKNVWLTLNEVPTLVIQTKQDADYVLRRNYANYEKNMAWFRQALGSSRFFENGQVWKNHKNLTQPYLNNFRDIDTIKLAQYHGQQALYQLAYDSSIGKITLDDKVFRKMAMSVLIEHFFSIALDSADINIDNIAQLMEYSSELSFVPAGKLNISYRRKLVQLRALRRQVSQELTLFRHASVVNPMIERILKAESEPDSLVVLEDELMTFLAAGSESTAAAIGWVCYLLAQYPEEQERLYQEAINHPHPTTWEALSHMPQLMTFTSEALRLYPPIPIIIRQSLAKDKIGCDLIEERQNILISFIGIMHDASIYPNPWSLNLPTGHYSPLNDKNSGINMAFSQGPRLCGGKDFALVELAGFISTFVRYGLFSPTSQLPPRFYWKSQMVQQGGHPVQVTLRPS